MDNKLYRAKKKDIREVRYKLSQLQICKMKDKYEYTCEFRNCIMMHFIVI